MCKSLLSFSFSFVSSSLVFDCLSLPHFCIVLSNSFISPHSHMMKFLMSADDCKINMIKELDLQMHSNLYLVQVQQMVGFIKVNAGWTRALHTSQLVSIVTAIWQSLGTQCLCMCTEYSTSVLEFTAWFGVISMLHI